MQEQLWTIALNALAILVPALAAISVELIRRKLGVEKMNRIQRELETKKELAALAVKFVEQVNIDYDGADKYSQALKWLVNRAGDIGLSVTVDEAEGLIEASLRAFKDTFGEEWANAVK
jgi:hypothetical protein